MAIIPLLNLFLQLKDDDMNESMIYLLVGFIGLVVLFAQLRMFSVDKSLKEILAELKRQNNNQGS